MPAVPTAILVAVYACAASAQSRNPFELAEPCRLAGERAIETVNGATAAEDYTAALLRLRGVVDSFVKEIGNDDEASLHCLNSYGSTLLQLGELEKASVVYSQATDIARKTFGDDDDATLTLQGNLAVALQGMGKLQESAQLQRDTLARREVLEDTPRAHKLAVTLINLAMTESSLGELAEARKWADRGFRLAQEYVKEDDPRYSTILHNYGMVLDRIGSRSEAQEYFERALDLRLKQDDTQGAIEALASLAVAFYDTGRYDESDRRYNEAYGLAQQRLPPLHPVRGQIGRSWRRVLSSIGKLQQSLAMCDEAIKVFSAHGDEGQLQVQLTQINRGVTLGLLGRAPEAIRTLRAAVLALRQTLPAGSPEVFEAVRSLGVVFIDSGSIEEGAALLATVLKEQQDLLGPLHPDVILTQGNYGVVLAMQGKLRESEAVLTDYATKADTMRGLYGRNERTVRGVFSRFASTRMFLAKLMIADGRCQAAFDLIENTKARSLADRISDQASFSSATTAEREVFDSLEQSRTRLFIERAQADGNGGRQTEIDGRLRAIDIQLGKLIETVGTRRAEIGRSELPSAAILRSPASSNTTLASFALAVDEILVVAFRASSGFQCTSLGQWTSLTDTIWATRALQSAPGGLQGLLAGSPVTPASRIVKTGTRSFAIIPREDPIPAEATVVNAGTDILSTIGTELAGWLVKRAAASTRLVISPDGILNLISFDALTVGSLAHQPLQHLPSEFLCLASQKRKAGSPSAELLVDDRLWRSHLRQRNHRHSQ